MDDRKSLQRAGSRKGRVAIDLECFLPLAVVHMSLALLDEVFRLSRSSRRATILVFVAKEPSGTLSLFTSSRVGIAHTNLGVWNRCIRRWQNGVPPVAPTLPCHRDWEELT
jgi:hypothetical protein